MRATAVNSEVLVVVDDDGKTRKGKIVEPITQGSARIAYDENSESVATYSEMGQAGTFHYPDQADLVKKRIAEIKKERAAAEKTPAAAK